MDFCKFHRYFVFRAWWERTFATCLSTANGRIRWIPCMYMVLSFFQLYLGKFGILERVQCFGLNCTRCRTFYRRNDRSIYRPYLQYLLKKFLSTEPTKKMLRYIKKNMSNPMPMMSMTQEQKNDICCNELKKKCVHTSAIIIMMIE